MGVKEVLVLEEIEEEVHEEEVVVEGHDGGRLEPPRSANHQPFIPKSHSSPRSLSPLLPTCIKSMSYAFSENEAKSFNPGGVGGGEVVAEGHGGELWESPRSANHRASLSKSPSSFLPFSPFPSAPVKVQVKACQKLGCAFIPENDSENVSKAQAQSEYAKVKKLESHMFNDEAEEGKVIDSSSRLKSQLSIKIETIDCSNSYGQTIDQEMGKPIGGGGHGKVESKALGHVTRPPERYESEQGGTRDSHEQVKAVKIKAVGKFVIKECWSVKVRVVSSRIENGTCAQLAGKVKFKACAENKYDKAGTLATLQSL